MHPKAPDKETMVPIRHAVHTQSVHNSSSVAARRVSRSWLVLRHSQSKRLTTSALHPRIDHSHAFKKGIVTTPAHQLLRKRSGYCTRTLCLRPPIIRLLHSSLEPVLSHCASSEDPVAALHNAVGALLKTMKFHKGIVASSICASLCINLCSQST
jgi:hypothetical protein